MVQFSSRQAFKKLAGVVELSDTCLVFVTNSFTYCTFVLIVQAHKRGIVYPKYQLLVYGWYSDGWWRESDPERLDCTQDQLNTALHHAMAPIQAEFYSNLSLVTKSGLVGGDG